MAALAAARKASLAAVERNHNLVQDEPTVAAREPCGTTGVAEERTMMLSASCGEVNGCRERRRTGPRSSRVRRLRGQGPEEKWTCWVSVGGRAERRARLRGRKVFLVIVCEIGSWGRSENELV